jgi:hypothetical protein
MAKAVCPQGTPHFIYPPTDRPVDSDLVRPIAKPINWIGKIYLFYRDAFIKMMNWDTLCPYSYVAQDGVVRRIPNNQWLGYLK